MSPGLLVYSGLICIDTQHAIIVGAYLAILVAELYKHFEREAEASVKPAEFRKMFLTISPGQSFGSVCQLSRPLSEISSAG